jgi:hypothetical protein
LKGPEEFIPQNNNMVESDVKNQEKNEEFDSRLLDITNETLPED